MTSKLLLALFSVLAAIIGTVNTAEFAALVPEPVARWATLAAGAIAIGLGFYNSHKGTMPADPLPPIDPPPLQRRL